MNDNRDDPVGLYDPTELRDALERLEARHKVLSPDEYDILECDIRPTALGKALRLRIHRRDRQRMSFRELWGVFARAYPGRWAVQVFPPEDRLIDQAHKYHLFVFDKAPHGMDLCAPNPPGTVRPPE